MLVFLLLGRKTHSAQHTYSSEVSSLEEDILTKRAFGQPVDD